MPEPSYTHLGGLRDIESFRRYLAERQINIPCDSTLISGGTSPLAQPIDIGDIKIGNRIAAQPMEGWDGTGEGRPTELTFRRWARFGASGAKLIWGGEAVAVRDDGRANPNQLLINKDSRDDLSRLRETLVTAHKQAVGSDSDLIIGLQLTHSGRYSRPNAHGRPEPKIVYHHPILDSRLGITSEYPVLTDQELNEIIEDFHNAAVVAAHAGFDFVDIKHCHGYLGHELLSAHTREGEFGGSFENRTRFLREITNAVRAANPALSIAVRFSAFDMIPFRKLSLETCGAPEPFDGLLPYRWAFGVNVDDPIEPDLREPIQFLRLLRDLGRITNRVHPRAFHFIDGEADDVHDECRRVGQLITQQAVDVAFVGIGENGHLAFNDPPADFDTDEPYIVVNLDDACRQQQVGEGWFKSIDEVPARAISMSIKQILRSLEILCIVPDRRKAEAVKASVELNVNPMHPASILQTHERVRLYLDRDSSALLSKRSKNASDTVG